MCQSDLLQGKEIKYFIKTGHIILKYCISQLHSGAAHSHCHMLSKRSPTSLLLAALSALFTPLVLTLCSPAIFLSPT